MEQIFNNGELLEIQSMIYGNLLMQEMDIFILYHKLEMEILFYLNVAGNSSNDGANVEIYQSNGGDSQKFMITENSNGSYIIKTKISNNNSAVEVSAYGKNSGDNIQQWSLTGHESQSWIFEPVSNPHAKLRSKNLEKNNSIKNDDEITKQFVYKEKDCVHTVIFIKSNK